MIGLTLVVIMHGDDDENPRRGPEGPRREPEEAQKRPRRKKRPRRNPEDVQKRPSRNPEEPRWRGVSICETV